MPEPRLIAFVGTVGSGKSTHMKLLYSKLKKKVKGKDEFSENGSPIRLHSRGFLGKNSCGYEKGCIPIRALVEERPSLFKKFFKLWLGLDLMSVTMKFLADIYVPLKLGYTY